MEPSWLVLSGLLVRHNIAGAAMCSLCANQHDMSAGQLGGKGHSGLTDRFIHVISQWVDDGIFLPSDSNAYQEKKVVL